MTAPHSQHPYPVRDVRDAVARAARAAQTEAAAPRLASPAPRIPRDRADAASSLTAYLLTGVIVVTGAILAAGYTMGARAENKRLAVAPVDPTHVAVARGHVAAARAALAQVGEAAEGIPAGHPSRARVAAALGYAEYVVGTMDCITDVECEGVKP